MKIPEAQLNNLAANFAGKYVEQKWKHGNELDRQLVLNILAHGFVMGVRACEKLWAPRWYDKFFERSKFTKDRLETLLLKNSSAYMGAKKLETLQTAKLCLCRACFSIGFREGFNYENYMRHS